MEHDCIFTTSLRELRTIANEREHSLLLVCSILSFGPQIHRLLSYGDSSGVSLTYLLLNLMVATYNLTFGLELIALPFVQEPIAHNPRTVGDWLNLSQLGAVWSCQVVL